MDASPPGFSSETAGTVFRSKIDAWLALVIAGALASMWVVPIRRVWADRAIDSLDTGVPLVATAFIVWVFTTTRYVITADALVVRSGPIRRTVPLRSVQRLRATHNPLSAPALSLDRIEVTYGGKRILISPHDKREFVSAVMRRVPGVMLDGLSAT